MEWKATVRSGKARGAYFVPIYAQKIEHLVNGLPFPGTLNLELETIPASYLDFKAPWVQIPGFTFEGNAYGQIFLRPIRLSNGEQTISGWWLKPARTMHEKHIVEVIYEKNIRELFNVDDGDVLTVTI